MIKGCNHYVCVRTCTCVFFVCVCVVLFLSRSFFWLVAIKRVLSTKYKLWVYLLCPPTAIPGRFFLNRSICWLYNYNKLGDSTHHSSTPLFMHWNAPKWFWFLKLLFAANMCPLLFADLCHQCFIVLDFVLFHCQMLFYSH